MSTRQLLTTSECRNIQLDILKKIDQFCQRTGLRYSLAYGTLIGAVRHQGYIPWDDDIDLMMPRPDYELFLREFRDDHLYLINLAARDDCVETFLKVCKKGTIMVDKSFHREIWGVNVDIFPIDGAPSEGLDTHYASLDTLREKAFRICPYYKSVHKGRASLYIKYVLKRVRHPYLHSFKFLKKKLADGQKAIPYDSSNTVGIYFAAEKTRTFMSKSVFDNIGNIYFEGKQYLAILEYDKYLTQLYGNYMQLPPVEKRVSHHYYDSFVEQ